LAPNLCKLISSRIVKRRTVVQALNNWDWVADVRGVFTVQVLAEYLQIRDLVDVLVLQQDVPDQHRWKLSSSGSYSSKSAYQTFFLGTIKFAPWKRIWKSWAPLKCKFFVSLAINNRCWTADRLAKRGMPHPQLNMSAVAPQICTTSFSWWWGSAVRGLPKEMCKLQRP